MTILHQLPISTALANALQEQANYIASSRELDISDVEQQMAIDFTQRANNLRAKNNAERLLDQTPAYIARRIGYYTVRAFYREVSFATRTIGLEESFEVLDGTNSRGRFTGTHIAKKENESHKRLSRMGYVSGETPVIEESVARLVALLRDIETRYGMTFSDRVWEALSDAPITDTNFSPLVDYLTLQNADLNPDADPETGKILSLFFAGYSLRRMMRENLAPRRKAEAIGRKLRDLLTTAA